MLAQINVTSVQATTEMIHQWGWFLALGILLAAVGVLAMIRSFASTVASMMFFGWLLIFGGAIELVESFMVGHWAGFFFHLLAAMLFLVVGFLLLVKPVISAEVATLLLSTLFLIGGLFQIIAAPWTHLHGWGWQLFDGLLSFLMGVLLLVQWPLSGLWAIGLFVGVDLLFTGFTWIALALDLRKM